MKRIIEFVRSHMDSWEEVCVNSSARLRLNLILFSLVISIVYFAMSVRTTIAVNLATATSTIVFGTITFSLFLLQFFRKKYNPIIAWSFGLMSLSMAAYFLVTGGLANTGHIWICILPIVGTMMVPFRSTLVYNGLLLAMIVVLFNTPLYDLIPAEYNPYMRVVFPISILILTLCNYVSEYTREHTQQQLIIMTEKLRDSAFTDPLTGVYNRRALTAHFGESDEDAYGLSFAMLDLDFFKKINDTYGHEIGDKLLCHLVSIVNRLIPPGAQLYRWGGEEFLLVIKTTKPAILEELLNSIQETVAQSPFVIERDGSSESLFTTVSIGGMTAAHKDTIESSINQADEQMYLAKAAGRNRVFVKAAEK